MKIKTSDLEGVALDWAVAMSEDQSPRIIYINQSAFASLDGEMTYEPSENPATLLFLINRSQMLFDTDDGSIIWAKLPGSKLWSGGQNHQIAACRAIVAAKLGDEVDIPEELA